MTLANVMQPDPEYGPEAKKEIEELNYLFYGPDTVEPGPGEIRIGRAGRLTGYLLLSRENPKFN